MTERKVVSSKQLPVRLPVVGTLVWYLFLDHVNAPSWVWGVMGTLLGLTWIFLSIAVWHQKEITLKELS